MTDRNRRNNRDEDQMDSGIIEGRNPVLEALRSGRTIDKILIARGSREGSIQTIYAMARDKRIVIQEVDRRRLDQLSETQGAHQGVIAHVTPYSYSTLDDILEHARSKEEDPFIVILDGIMDPHNLGSIIRTAECLGVHGIVIPKRRAASLSPSTIKASAGAIEFMKVAKVTNISDTIDRLKEEGLWVAGADMDGSEPSSHNLKGPLALIVGGEDKGLSRLVKEKCDFLISIPMTGQISSLNASVAAAILIYEIAKENAK